MSDDQKHSDETSGSLRVLEVPVAGGMCRLRFEPGVFTGMEITTNPGVGFDYISESERLIPDRSGDWHGGMGVIGRDDARRLADMLHEFLCEHPVTSQATQEEP